MEKIIYNIIANLLEIQMSQRLNKVLFAKEFQLQTGIEFNEEWLFDNIKYEIDKPHGNLDLLLSLVFFLSNRLSKDMKIMLSKVLLLKDHKHHEDIAVLLQQEKDPNTVENLFKAAELNFEYLSYDETHQFGRKCIKALSAIDNSNSIEKLILLSKSKNSLISKYAIKELDYKGINY